MKQHPLIVPSPYSWWPLRPAYKAGWRQGFDDRALLEDKFAAFKKGQEFERGVVQSYDEFRRNERND